MRARAVPALASGALAAMFLSLAPTAEADPLDVLGAYAGTWHAEIDNLADSGQPASHEAHTIKNDCWRSGLYYACTQTVDGKQLAMLVFTWDEGSKSYSSYPITADGGAAGHGKLVVQGDDWIFPWDNEKPERVVHFRVVNHWVGRDRIEYRAERSTDGSTWTVTGRGVEVRQ